jgi:DNA-binding MarR family transcriptional regulator
VSSESGPGPELSRRLGYLLKHAQLQMADLTAAALEPYGINGRELAVLLVLAGREPQSQQQAAKRLGIDRTTMVALLDALEAKGLVSRHQHQDDRRRNVVELTEPGRSTLRQASKASDKAEAELLSPLTPTAAETLRTALRTIVMTQEEQS